MKHWILGLLIIVGALSCRQDEAGPGDLLYRTWRMTQIQYTNGKPVDVQPDNEWSIVTFRANGTILYGTDGKYDPCCSPARFNRKGDILDLVDVESIPFPKRTPNPMCALVSCVSPGNAWQIDELSPNRLIIKQGYGVATYQPYP